LGVLAVDSLRQAHLVLVELMADALALANRRLFVVLLQFVVAFARSVDVVVAYVRLKVYVEGFAEVPSNVLEMNDCKVYWLVFRAAEGTLQGIDVG